MVQAASVIVLTVAASSAGAWYGAPDQAGYLTDPQQQAAADRQRAFEQQQQAFAAQRQAMAAQHAKAAEQAMAARRQFAEQQAARFKNAPRPAPAMDPRVGNAAAPAWAGPAFPTSPEQRRFERPAMPEFAMPEMPAPRGPDFKAPEFPAWPEMPGFERPAMSDFAGNRGPALDAHRAQARQEMAARRNAMKEQSDRRRAAHGFGPRPVGPGAGMGCAPAAAPAVPQAAAPAAPQAAAPAVVNPTTVAAAQPKQ
jgi:hypothetical protein